MLVCPPDSVCAGSGLCTGYLLADEAQAIAAWNRRAPTPAPQQQSSSRLLGYIRDDGVFSRFPFERRPCDGWTEAWSAPQPPVPLTTEQIAEVWVEHGLDDCDPEGFARLIEAAHGITGAPDDHQQT